MRKPYHKGSITLKELVESAKLVSSGCLEWQYALVKGYGDVRRNGKRLAAHRLVYSLFHGRNVEELKTIMHTCDNRKCINPDHLREGSHLDNMRDAVAKKRHQHGEAHKFAKFKTSLIKKARNLHLAGMKQIDISKLLGIEQSYVSRIINNKARALN